MEEKTTDKTPEKPKKSKWLLWTCGSCGCLVIIIMVALFSLRSFTGFNIGKFFDNSQNNGSNLDEEDKEMTKSELIDYFVGETTVYPGFDKSIKVMKWEKPVVTISVADTPPEGGIKAIDDFINKFNNNSTKTKLQRIESDGDIKIYFQVSTDGAAGRSGPSSGADYIIDHANIKLSEEAAMFDQSLSSVLSHEIFHALGFTGHYQGSACRLMSPTVCGSRLTINEERLIQMLYSTDMPDGINESEIRSFLQNWSPNN
ncbi:MAG: hypothetical protein WCV58_00615 [Patescibacteria group bacterium]